MGAVRWTVRMGEFIKSAMEMLVRFTVQVGPQLEEWGRRLRENPAELDTIEHDVRNEYLRGAGMMIAGLVSVVLQSKELARASERTRRDFSNPLAKGRERKIAVRLLGGVLMWVTSLYCEPKRGLFRKPDDHAVGLYIELAQFGFGKKESPGLETRVARQSALCPSFELAQAELSREGLSIRGELRESTPEPEKRSEDGLLISDAPGRSKPRAKQSFDAEWREPKLMTIFIHDEHGRMVKKSKATIDGTFAGPDAMAELVAMHLHRLGAGKAKSLTFVSDGAVWIRDRIDAIVKQAGIPETVKVHQVLDNCHAAHHVSLALKELGLAEADRMPSYRDLRSRLRNGEWRYVVQQLQQHADASPELEKLQTEVNYLQRHGEAGRLAYPTFRGLGIPLGSGAIESSIRRRFRVQRGQRKSSMRLKGNGIFWREESAESMLQLRALVISDRWDERVRLMRQSKRSTHLHDWQWTPRPMSCKVEPESKTLKTLHNP